MSGAYLSNWKLLSLDDAHRALCIDISARACALVDKSLKLNETRHELETLLRRGSVKELFLEHVRAQGGSLTALNSLLDTRKNRRDRIALAASTHGYWRPPDVNRAKEWLKSEQQRVQSLSGESTASWRAQVGLKLCRTLGDKVNVRDTVIEIRHPGSLRVNVPPWLVGATSKAPPAKALQLLE